LLSPLKKRGDIQSRQIGIQFICTNFLNHAIAVKKEPDRLMNFCAYAA